MPKVSERPKKLQPYLFYGIDLAEGGKEAIGECPFCGKEEKFSVDIETGQYKCWSSCVKPGNTSSFLQRLHKLGQKITKEGHYEDLAEERGLLYASTPKAWGAVISPTQGNWLIPGYNSEGTLTQLYAYAQTKKGKRLLATSGLSHQMHGMNLWNEKAPELIWTEGPWDGMALWEVLSRCSLNEEEKLQVSGSPDLVNVLAVPGANVFNPKWAVLGKNRVVSFCYDNDHKKIHPTTGEQIPPAGITGAKQAIKAVSSSTTPPSELYYLSWGAEGSNLELPNGFDVRDKLQEGDSKGLGARIEACNSLIESLVPVPAEWLGSPARASQTETVQITSCEVYRDLQNAWKVALKWTPGLDYALSVMLACIASTQSVGDQLWLKLIGPAATGKSTLAEALSTARKYVVAKSTMRGFHSGFGDGVEDHSLISQLNGKTLITKDGDTLLQSPNLGQILSEGRDLYDTVSRTSYRNKASKDYEGIRTTWILCGTSSLRSIDQSELGERFLDCVIMEGIDSDLEDEILWRVANRAERNLNLEADGRPDTRQEPEMTKAMALTGGYVCYLREHATELLSSVVFSDDQKRRCIRFAKFVAHMRARPSDKQKESSEREFAPRLTSQLIRLAKCLAVVLNKPEVDDIVIQQTRRVALDTSRGRTLEILKHLYQEDQGIKALAVLTNQPDKDVRAFLRFMREIEVLRNFRTKNRGISWELTDSMRELYEEVMIDDK